MPKTRPTIYLDLDGTLLGNKASLLHDHEGNQTTAGVDALFKAENSGAEIVVATGRDVYRTTEFCRSVGIEKYIAELGCVINTAGGRIIEYGDKTIQYMQEHNIDTSQFLDEIKKAAQFLIDSNNQKLEFHSEYNRDRLASYLLRGNINIGEANNLLANNGWPYLEIIANGHGMFRRTMPSVDNVLIYHLTPIGITKAYGIQQDQQLRGLKKMHCYIIGDGMADAQCWEVVNTVYMPINGPLSDPNVEQFVKSKKNIVVLSQSHNLGFAQAIDNILSQY